MMDQKIQDVPECWKVIQGQVFGWLHVEVLAQLTEQVRLVDAVCTQLGLQVDIKLDDLGRIAGVLDYEIHQERLQLGGV